MIPATGFLAQVNNTNVASETVPLPEPFEYTYADGSPGPFQDHDEDFTGDIDTVLLTQGSFFIQKEFGFDDEGEFGFKITIRQVEAHSIVLLDYMDPPAMEQFIQL